VTEPVIRHEDVAGYVLGSLTPAERAAFERHLDNCPSCREQVRELSVPAELVRRSAPAYDTPPDLRERTFAAIEREASQDGPRPSRAPRRPVWRRSLAVVAAATALVVGGVLAASVLDRLGTEPQVELEAVLSPPGDGAERARVIVVKTGVGREISFESDDLPILPHGEYYELWFVGPGDTRRRPNRISAGTFHPDEQGRSRVELTAAVDPALYPVLSVTAEPADGNPRRTGPEVLRSQRD
jgi:anti-sigma-K factor RskA